MIIKVIKEFIINSNNNRSKRISAEEDMLIYWLLLMLQCKLQVYIALLIASVFYIKLEVRKTATLLCVIVQYCNKVY